MDHQLVHCTAQSELSEMYFARHDPECEMRKYRNFIPYNVLKEFCGDFYNQVMGVDDPEIITIYKPDRNNFERQHFSESFGDDNIYFAYFDNLSREAWMRDGFRKFDTLKRVDGEIYTLSADAIWLMRKYQPTGSIPLTRGDVAEFRKHLFLVTSIGSRDRTTHLLAKSLDMDGARQRRHHFVTANKLEHTRDVWLQNSEKILQTPHHLVPESKYIFDLDRADYRANARERYPVFWEAPPGEEFVLTDSGFGGFEGGEIGARKNSKIDMTAGDFEMHIYTKDFMWHQLYVLSPTLIVALCHPTLMHPDLTKQQRKQWGLRRSLLEDLPHGVPNKYYKDMTKSEMSFSKNNWVLPVEVEKAFASPQNKGYQRRDDEALVFQVNTLSPAQVSLVNSVLLHNQHLGPKIKNICIRPASHASLHQSLLQFQRNPWSKYSVEIQNDYQPLLDVLTSKFANPMSSGTMSPTYHYQQPAIARQMPHVYDPIQQQFAEVYALQTGVEPRYEQYLETSVQPHLMVHSASSLTSSFTPSSQSSYSYSSASSQSSASTKTTNIDTPRFEMKHMHQPRTKSPTRQELKVQRDEGVRLNGSHRGSDSSGKTVRSKVTDKSVRSDPQGVNIVIEQTMLSGGSSQSSGGVPIHRGRNPEPVQYYSGSNPGSKKSSPNPTRAEIDASRLQRQHVPEPPMIRPQHLPPPVSTRPNRVPEMPSHLESRPKLQERARTEPQPPVLNTRVNNEVNYGTLSGMEQYMMEPPVQTQTQRRVRSPERPTLQRAQTQRDTQSIMNAQDRQSAKYDRGQTYPIPRSANQSPEREVEVEVEVEATDEPRVRQYETLPPSQAGSNSHENPKPMKAQRHTTSHERTNRIVDSVSERLRQVVNSDLPPPQPQRINRSPDRKPEPQRAVNETRDKKYHGSTTNGNVYQVVSGQQQQTAPPAKIVPAVHTQQNEPTQQQPTVQTQPQLLDISLPAPQLQVNQQQNGTSSRNTSTTTEHAVRPGVEIVRGRREQPPIPQPQHIQAPVPTKLPAPVVIVEKVEPKQVAPTYHKGSATAEIPVIKQLRFETPTKSVNHKFSDLSLSAGSMVAHAGDSPGQLQRYQDPEESESDSESSTESQTESEDDETSWEDEGFAEAEEIASKPKPTVRFADKPMSRSPVRNPVPAKSALVRTGGVEIERPSSRLGKRVEIPRPLSRNGHARFERFESRKAKLPRPAAKRLFN